MGTRKLVDDEDTNPKGDGFPPKKTYLTPAVQARIKAEVRKTWERVSGSRKLTQNDLAAAWEVSSGGASKLLNDEKGHPLTPTYLKRAAAFMRVSSPAEEFLAAEDRDELRSLFDGFVIAEPDGAFLEECTDAIKNHFEKRGIPVKTSRIYALAGKLCEKLEGSSPSHEDMTREIDLLVNREAAHA
jgi:hypothetical protein